MPRVQLCDAACSCFRIAAWFVVIAGLVADCQVTTDLDAEAAGTIMLLELVFVLGFTVPMLLVVTAAAMLLHAMAFEMCVQYQGAVLMHEARPPVRYLYLSLAMGGGLVLWMFVDCSWVGRTLICVAMPLSGIVGVMAPEMLLQWSHLTRSIDTPELQVSLLDGMEEQPVVCVRTARSEPSSRSRAHTEFFDVEDESDRNCRATDFYDFNLEVETECEAELSIARRPTNHSESE